MAFNEKEKCEIKGCNNEVVKSISTRNLLKELSGVTIDNEKKKRTHICKEHYKKYKKATKEKRKLNRLGRR